MIWSAINVGSRGQSRGTVAGSVNAGAQNSTAPSKRTDPVPAVHLRRGLTEPGCELLTKLLPSITKCVKLCLENTSTESKDMLESFAQVFTVLDPRSFQDIFGMRMPFLLNFAMENPGAIAKPQQFLLNINISKYFADILLSFIVSRLKDMGSEDKPCVAASEKMSKILFFSVSHFLDNEPVLRYHLSQIMRYCLDHASTSEDPSLYLQIQTNIFKALRDGKFDLQFNLIYRHFMPLVEPLLVRLMELYDSLHRLKHGNRILELCLYVPARPSTIFPHLKLQMRPILLAISSNVPDLVELGFRTLKFWINSLQPAYFHELLDRVEPDLSAALHRHLKPAPYSFGENALRVLGKLGARNHTKQWPARKDRLEECSEDTLAVTLNWETVGRFRLPLYSLCRTAANARLDERPVGQLIAEKAHKNHTWRF